MAEYYAVERSQEYLAHYGVRGMKWGVRKAIASGNSDRLAKHYAKASKKLQKLNDRTNISKQKEEYKQRFSNAGTFGMAGAASAGIGIGLHKYARANNKRIIGMAGFVPFDSETSHYVGGAAGGLMGAAGAYNLGKGIAAKYRTTKKGHAKAVAKRDAWQKEMQSAFKGTRYSNKNIQAIKSLANSFDKRYQKGLSKGMNHEQAERYANNLGNAKPRHKKK